MTGSVEICDGLVALSDYKCRNHQLASTLKHSEVQMIIFDNEFITILCRNCNICDEVATNKYADLLY